MICIELKFKLCTIRLGPIVAFFEVHMQKVAAVAA
jgi:hypothetical protein